VLDPTPFHWVLAPEEVTLTDAESVGNLPLPWHHDRYRLVADYDVLTGRLREVK
jgi:hypothetical protein